MQKDPQQQYQAQFNQQYRIPFDKKAEWKKYLDQNGFVVIANYLPKQEMTGKLDQIWKMMEKLSVGRLKRNNLLTQNVRKNYPSFHHGGLMQHIGHTNFQWDIRKKTKKIFSELWNTQDVKTSFDGVTFSNGRLNFEIKSEHQGLHVDQAPIKTELESYQGIMAITDAGNNGGGFVCVPKSHKYFNQFFKEKGIQNQTTSYHFTADEIKKEPMCNFIKTNVKAGDFIIFESRTFHCGTVPTNNNLRVCTYVCMLPSDRITEQVQEKRNQGFALRRNSGHLCGDGYRTFARMPKRLPKIKQDIEPFAEQMDKYNNVGNEQLEKDKEIMSLV